MSTLTVPAGNSRVVFWTGTAPSTAVELRDATVVYDLHRDADGSGGDIFVASVDLDYVHQSWGVLDS